MPSSGKWATLGGMAATNAAGASAVRSGSVRHWISALEWVDAEGESHRWARGEATEPRPRWAALERRIRKDEPPFGPASPGSGRTPRATPWTPSSTPETSSTC